MSTATTLTTDTNQAIVQQYFAASRGVNKAEAMAACFAEDCMSWDPVGQPAFNGYAEVYQFLQAIVNLFASVELTEDFITVNNNEVAVKWTGHGVGKNGCEVTFQGIDLFEVNAHGRIQTLRAYWNPTPILTKLQSA